MRISRIVASMSSAESRPLPRRFLNVVAKRSESVSNTSYSSFAGTQRDFDGATESTERAQGAQFRTGTTVPADPPPSTRVAAASRCPTLSVLCATMGATQGEGEKHCDDGQQVRGDMRCVPGSGGGGGGAARQRGRGVADLSSRGRSGGEQRRRPTRRAAPARRPPRPAPP